MYRLKKISILFISLIVSTAVYPASVIPLKSLFTSNEIRLAKEGEFLTSVILKGKGNASTGGVEMHFPVQNRYIAFPASGYDMIALEKGFFQMEGNSSNRTKIYKSLTDFSILKGMNYYSQSQSGNSTLILDAYRIPSPNDSLTENAKDRFIPLSSVSHFAIRDNRLGKLLFKSDFKSIDDDFIVCNTLTGRASKFGMEIFYPGDYLIYKILIYDKSLKGYFLYTAQFMKVRSGILNKMDLVKPESFGNRVRAENVHFLKSIGIDRSWKLSAFK